MKFCPECGTKIEGMKFCPECGYQVGEAEAARPTKNDSPSGPIGEIVIMEFSTFMYGLEGKKKNIVGNIDISLPQYNYTLTSERLLIEKHGVVSAKREEVELYKIKDVSVHQSMKDKMLKVGDVIIESADESTPKFVLKNIKDPNEVKEAIRHNVQKRKHEIGMRYRQDI